MKKAVREKEMMDHEDVENDDDQEEEEVEVEVEEEQQDDNFETYEHPRNLTFPKSNKYQGKSFFFIHS